MMKNTFLYAIACFLLASFTVNAQGINFQKGTWADIKAKAKAEKKHIFVDAYTVWCGPCKWQSKKVFPQKKVGDFFNKHFVAYKMDMEKGEGLAFAKEYGVKIYPTLVYFNPEGEMVHKTVGASPADKLLKAATDALNPETQFITLQHRFEKGEKSNVFLEKYIKALEAVHEDFTGPTQLYLDQLGQEKWATVKGWKFINHYVKKSSSKVFEYVMKNQAQFERVAKEKRDVKNYISEVWGYDMKQLEYSKDKSKAKLEVLIQRLKKAFGESREAEKQIARAMCWFYVGDSENSFQYACRYFDNYCDDAWDFTHIAYIYSTTTNDAQKLEKALAWVEKSVKLAKDFGSLHIQAHLLYKLKRYKEAKTIAEASIALDKKGNGSVMGTKKLLEKINAKL